MSYHQCPRCARWSPSTTMQCDCGYQYLPSDSNDAKETDAPIVVATMTGRPIAELLKASLEEQGIPCALSQSGLGASYGGVIGPFAHVDVLVAGKFKLAAMEIVNAFQKGDPTEPPQGE